MRGGGPGRQTRRKYPAARCYPGLARRSPSSDSLPAALEVCPPPPASAAFARGKVHAQGAACACPRALQVGGEPGAQPARVSGPCGRGRAGGGRTVPGWRAYLGAVAQQHLCKGSADALRRAGHQRHFAVHVHGGRCWRWAARAPCGRGFYGPARAARRAPPPVGGEGAAAARRAAAATWPGCGRRAGPPAHLHTRGGCS